MMPFHVQKLSRAFLGFSLRRNPSPNNAGRTSHSPDFTHTTKTTPAHFETTPAHCYRARGADVDTEGRRRSETRGERIASSSPARNSSDSDSSDNRAECASTSTQKSGGSLLHRPGAPSNARTGPQPPPSSSSTPPSPSSPAPYCPPGSVGGEGKSADDCSSLLLRLPLLPHHRMASFFRSPHPAWWLIIPPALIFTFVSIFCACSSENFF